MSEDLRQVSTLAVAIGTYAGAEAVGGNGFIAAFVGGLVFGVLASRHCEGVYAFAEEEGALLTLLVFVALGASLAPEGLVPLDVATVAYVVASLTVVRMLPIAVSLVGAGVRPVTAVFLGWFGPRGLATIIFGLLVVDEVGGEVVDVVYGVALWAVLASVVAHGVSAVPLTSAYVAALDAHRASMAAGQEMSEHGPSPRFPLGRAAVRSRRGGGPRPRPGP